MNENTGHFTPPPTPRPPKKKKPISLIICMIVAVAATLIFTGAPGDLFGGHAGNNAIVRAHYDDAGAAYIPLDKGELVAIEGGVEFAFMTADRKLIIVQLDDGSLYAVDTSSNRIDIADNCHVLFVIRDDGFFYEDEDNVWYFVGYKSLEPVELFDYDELYGLEYAENTGALLFATEDGGIFTRRGGDKPVEVGSFHEDGDEVQLVGVSDDGKLSVWLHTVDHDELKLVVNVGDEQSIIFYGDDGDIEDFQTAVMLSAGDRELFAVVLNFWDYSRVFLIKPNGKIVDAKISGSALYYIYTDQGPLSCSSAARADAVYLHTIDFDDNSYTLYRVSSKGESDRVISDFKEFSIYGGSIFYTTEEDELYYARLDGAGLKDEMEIDDDVVSLYVSHDGRYVYYIAEYDFHRHIGTLYCWKTGSDEPQKVSPDTYPYLTLSTEGDTVFFSILKGISYSSYDPFGTLCSWTYGDKAPVEIDGDVIRDSLTSHIDLGIDPKDFYYKRFVSYDEFDLMHYDGETAAEVASGLVD